MWDLLKVVSVIFLPPVAVLMHSGLSLSFVFNVILTMLGYFPGLIHALFVMVAE